MKNYNERSTKHEVGYVRGSAATRLRLAAARLAARLRLAAGVGLRLCGGLAARCDSIATAHKMRSDNGDGSDGSRRSDDGEQHEDEPECAALPAMRGVRNLESM